AVQQRQRRRAQRSAFLADLRGSRRCRRGSIHPSGTSCERRHDAGVLADAAGRLPVRHDARRSVAGLRRRCGALSEDPLGALPSRRRDSVSRRTARSRLPCLQGLPRQHPEGAERVSEGLLLRHRELQPGRAEAGHRFRGRRSRARRQRLPAPDRQHPVDARGDCRAAGHRRPARADPLAQRRTPARSGGEGPMTWKLAIVAALALQAPKAEMTRVPQFENDRAVSWKSVIPPHTESTLHRHDRYRTVIGIVGGNLTTVTADGHKTVTRYETGKAYWQEPMRPGEMHKDVNETDRTLELMVVELKN